MATEVCKGQNGSATDPKQLLLTLSSPIKVPNDKKFSHHETNGYSDNIVYSEEGLYKLDENKDRGNWSGRLDFLLSMVGYSVGIGNVWRFPYLCYKNGGGVFLIPYVITLFIIGLPFFYLEVNLGQFTSEGTLTCWKFSPIFKGVGVAMVVLSGVVTIYYNVLIAYGFYFLFASFTSKLPWGECDNWWNTDYCTLTMPLLENCTSFLNETYEVNANGTCSNGTDVVGVWNNTIFTNMTGFRRRSPTEEYWSFRVLQKTDSISDPGGMQWELFGVLALSWVVCFLCLSKGIKSTGKVVYFTALFPYIVLIILFVKGLTLEGYYDGIDFYINPTDKWDRLLTAEVWKDAATQVFYSMGMGWGGLIALASYNKFHNNSLRDSLFVPLCSGLTSFFSGFVIFSYLGYMARTMNVDIEDVATSGMYYNAPHVSNISKVPEHFRFPFKICAYVNLAIYLLHKLCFTHLEPCLYIHM